MSKFIAKLESILVRGEKALHFLSAFVNMCVNVGRVPVCAHVDAHMWRSEYSLRCLFSEILCHLFWQTVSLAYC